MNDPIEEARSPWAGWVIAIAHGGRYLGRGCVTRVREAIADECLPEAVPDTLSPVYELNVQLVRSGDGKVGLVYSCAPVLLLHGWKSMRLPDDALLCQLETLSLPERQRLMAAAQQGAAIVDELKLAGSPIAQPRIVRP